MNVQAIGGFSYITFIDDHSRYGHVYLMKHKLKHLKGSRNLDLRLKNKVAKVLRYFDLIEVENT